MIASCNSPEAPAWPHQHWPACGSQLQQILCYRQTAARHQPRAAPSQQAAAAAAPAPAAGPVLQQDLPQRLVLCMMSLTESQISRQLRMNEQHAAATLRRTRPVHVQQQASFMISSPVWHQQQPHARSLTSQKPETALHFVLPGRPSPAVQALCKRQQSAVALQAAVAAAAPRATARKSGCQQDVVT